MKIDHAYFVNIYNIGRAYGGPEEGGWYYDFGTPIEKEFDPELFERQAIFTDWEEAHSYAESLRTDLKELNRIQGNYHPSSVLSNGDYLNAIVEFYPAKAYPETIPDWE